MNGPSISKLRDNGDVPSAKYRAVDANSFVSGSKESLSVDICAPRYEPLISILKILGFRTQELPSEEITMSEVRKGAKTLAHKIKILFADRRLILFEQLKCRSRYHARFGLTQYVKFVHITAGAKIYFVPL